MDFESAAESGDAAQRGEDRVVTERDGPEEAAPWEVDVDLGGDAVEFFGQVLDRRLDEHRVREAAFGGFPRRFHRRLTKRLRVRVDADVEVARVRFGVR